MKAIVAVVAVLVLVAGILAFRDPDPKHPRRLVGRWERISYHRRTGQFIDLRRDGTTTFYGWEKHWEVRHADSGKDYLCTTPDLTNDCWLVELAGDTLHHGFTDLVKAK